MPGVLYGLPTKDAMKSFRRGIDPRLSSVRLLLMQALAMADGIDNSVSSLVACSISLAIDQLDDPTHHCCR